MIASPLMTVEELLSRGASAPGAQKRLEARTDARGEIALRLDEVGPWLIKVVHMEATEGDPDTDWESWWASLTLAVQPDDGWVSPDRG